MVVRALPKQQRSVLTRERLRTATIACLVERGLAQTSTSDVAARAEVAQGTVFRHFATKDDLLAAAVAQMLADFVDEFRGGAAAMIGRAPGELVTLACAMLWRIFRRPEMRAVFEVYVAAHTDRALADRLAPILERHRTMILAQARALFPAAAALPTFDGAVDAIVFSMQGAALGIFSPDACSPTAGAEVEHLAFLERLARRELGLEATPPITRPSTPRRAS